MTALGRYAKLEAVARYLDGVSPEAREVVLSFGERSLVIVGLDDRPIAHWPLASLRALGRPAERPLELLPDPASDERLLLDDPEMRAAIAEVCPRLHVPPPPRRRRRRPALWAAGAAAVAGLALLALMPALPDSLVDMVPTAREEALGEAAAARVAALLGPGPAPDLCIAEEGAAALRALAARLAPAAALPYPLRVSVLDHPAADALTLPGGRVLILSGLIDAARSPEELAGVLAQAAARAARRDPMRATLERAGTAAVTSVLLDDITGASAVAAAAASALAPVPAPQIETRIDEDAFAILASAGLPTLAFADLLGRLSAGAGEPPRLLAGNAWTPERDRRARAADAIGGEAFQPALGDREWIALGNICDRTAPVGH